MKPAPYRIKFGKIRACKGFGLDPNKCIVTPIPRRWILWKSSQEVHQKYGIPTDKYIYFIGNLEPRKNLKVLLEAYLQLPIEIRREYSLILAGSRGWKNESLQNDLESWKIRWKRSSYWIYQGSQADSPALYQKQKCFCHAVNLRRVWHTHTRSARKQLSNYCLWHSRPTWSRRRYSDICEPDGRSRFSR